MNEPTEANNITVLLDGYSKTSIKVSPSHGPGKQTVAETRWIDFVGTAMPDKLYRWKGKEIDVVIGDDGKAISIITPPLPASSGNPTSSPRSSSGGWRPGRSEEETRRIARQACLNTATNIYSEALKVNAGTFHSSESVATPEIAAALKFEIIRIAEQLEAWVFR
jgi:hypothetical protein